MFGNIARWLRILGFDTVYAKQLRINQANDIDRVILFRAIHDKRILITGDRQLYNNALGLGVRAIYINPRLKKNDALALILESLNIKKNKINPFSRCPICNGQLRKISKDKIRDKVPETTYSLHNDFWICTSCGHIYWVGSHYKFIKSTIEIIFRRVTKNAEQQ